MLLKPVFLYVYTYSVTTPISNHMDHVTTQLPYALICAAIAVVGYLVQGLTGSVWLSFGLVIIIIGILLFFLSKNSKKIDRVTIK